MTATTAPATYVRGTPVHKVTSASVPAGTVLLTFQAGEHVVVADKKTGAELREVASTERVAPEPFGRQVRIVVHFTDGTRSIGQAPSQTWMAITPSAEALGLVASEEPATAPLEVVTLDGETLSVETTPTETAETVVAVRKLEEGMRIKLRGVGIVKIVGRVKTDKLKFEVEYEDVEGVYGSVELWANAKYRLVSAA
jgi:hypothetical protein